MGIIRGVSAAASVVALAVLAGASSASASVTLGQLPRSGLLACNSDLDRVQTSVTSGNGYAAPVAGTITSWSTHTTGGMTMKVFRQISPTVFSVVGHAGPENLTGAPQTFPANVHVQAGDILGLYVTQVNTGCAVQSPGDLEMIRFGNLADLEAGTFTENDPVVDFRNHISANLDPDNAFTLGAVTRNKKKGTATINVNVPNPGTLVAAGTGVTGSAESAGPGAVQLVVRAEGKKKGKLRRKGKVAVAPTITFTPQGGDPSTQSTNLKLRRSSKK